VLLSRAVLKRSGIGINDASNGEFLPIAVDQALHTKHYYEYVNELLAAAQTREKAWRHWRKLAISFSKAVSGYISYTGL
jgi:HNH/ENDO VII superfamily nuclease